MPEVFTVTGNPLNPSEVDIDDLGIRVSPGEVLTFTWPVDAGWFEDFRRSEDTILLAEDDAHSGTSSLIIGDGSAGVPVGAVRSFLGTLLDGARPDGNITLSYDGSGRLDTVAFATGDTTSLTYAPGGELQQVDSPGETTNLTFTSGQLTAVTFS